MGVAGLEGRVTEMLRRVFSRYSDIDSVVLFGSRAKGTAKHNSDIDLAIVGVDNDLRIEKIALELDSLPLPYKFDVQSFSSIRNPVLRDHINRVGVKIYEKRDELKLGNNYKAE
ncbi:MAG: nucleotidyltransferase domain-containing protein [Desulfitobacteriaceae bacterium]